MKKEMRIQIIKFLKRVILFPIIFICLDFPAQSLVIASVLPRVYHTTGDTPVLMENLRTEKFRDSFSFEPKAEEKPISLAGEWRFEIADTNAQAFARVLSGKIHLPGTLDDAGLGPKNAEQPTLEGPYRIYNYAGSAYYQRDIEIPDTWSGKRVTLFLERCRWTTKVWIDDTYIGTQESLIAPHLYDFGTVLSPGRHRLTICVDNTVKLDLGRFVSALFGGTWGNMNGIIGRIELGATPPVWIDNVQVYPDIMKKTARVKVRIGNSTGKAGSGTLKVGVKNMVATWDVQGGQAEVEVDMSSAKLWDEFTPNLSELTVNLGDHERTVRFGMREFSSKGTQFTLNGRAIFLRGTLECSVWPLTGYPPTDVEAWQRIYRIIKSYGLNHMRFHSWCPPEAAFAAADAEGILLQVEAPMANVNAGSDLVRDEFITAEHMRIVDTYGNHPSCCMMALGNEFGGKEEVLTRWVEMLIKHDSRHLYSSASNNALRTENRQFTVTGWGRGVKGQGTVSDLHDIAANYKHPAVGHEIGQWMYYPDLNEIKKWNGVMALKNYEIIRDDLKNKRQLDLAPTYYQASGEFATLLYKEEIEVLLRSSGYGGFALLDLHDYPTQGTAVVGPLDAFWDSKGFITPEDFRAYCSETVPLIRMPKRTYTIDEPFKANVELAHFGSKDFANAQPVWTIKDQQGKIVDRGKLENLNIPTGKLSTLGEINASLVSANAPCKLKISIALDGTEISNDWDIWVYPVNVAPMPSADVTVCENWDLAKEALEKGKKVLFFANKTITSTSLPGKFLPVFWSPVWFQTQRPNTMGLLCESKHPFFAKFPTEFHSNWQWYNLMEHSLLFKLDETPASYRPMVQVIDNFNRNHKLGVVFEAKVGKGKLLVCGIDPKAAPADAATRQFLAGLYDYTASAQFKPTQELNQTTLENLFVPVFSSITSSSYDPPLWRRTFTPENAIDGDPISHWQSRSGAPASTYPHELILEINKSKKLSGLHCLPAQTPAIDAKNIRRDGWIKDYEVYVSDDGKSWGNPVAKGTFSYDESQKTILFSKPVETKFLKFVAINGFDPASLIASLAEISLILD